MLITRCKKCGLVIFAGVDMAADKDALFSEPQWSRDFPCIVPRCGGRAERIPMQEGLKGQRRIMAPGIYYRALHGLGAPVSPAPLEKVTEYLLNKRIVRITGFEVGQPVRSIVEEIEFEDGMVFHFAQSSHGACIFNMDMPGVLPPEMFDEPRSVSPSGDFEVGKSDRGETRRVADGAETEAEHSDQADALEGGCMPPVPTPSGVHPGA